MLQNWLKFLKTISFKVSKTIRQQLKTFNMFMIKYASAGGH